MFKSELKPFEVFCFAGSPYFIRQCFWYAHTCHAFDTNFNYHKSSRGIRFISMTKFDKSTLDDMMRFFCKRSLDPINSEERAVIENYLNISRCDYAY